MNIFEMEQFNQVALSTIGVIFLMFLFVLLLKRLRYPRAFSNKKIFLCGSVPLGSKEKLVLIEVDGQKVLLGVTPHQIQNLMVLEERGSRHQVHPFDEMLKNMKRKEGETGT